MIALLLIKPNIFLVYALQTFIIEILRSATSNCDSLKLFNIIHEI